MAISPYNVAYVIQVFSILSHYSIIHKSHSNTSMFYFIFFELGIMLFLFHNLKGKAEFPVLSNRQQIKIIKDAMPVSFRSELFTSYVVNIFM